jgi:hypothetical protein
VPGRRSTALAITALCCLIAAPAADAKADSGVRGTITVGGCPGPASEDGAGCTSGPLKATVRVLKACDRSEVKRFTSRKRDGHYRVRLRPGRYVLDPLEEGTDSYALYKGTINVRVHKHKFAKRDIAYDNGMR